MDKSDLEDGEVTSSDIDEPPPLYAKSADTAVTSGQPKPVITGGDVIDITVDTASSPHIIEIPSDDNAARSSTARKDTTSQRLPAADGSSNGDGEADRRASSLKTTTKRRNQKRKQKERDHAKKSKTEAQIAQLEAAEMDEYELLCVRGASPPRHVPRDAGRYDDGSHSKRRRYADTEDDDDSDSGAYDRNSTPAERRERRRKRGGSGRRHQLSGSADDVANNAAAAAAANLLRQPRKMELCKFFLTGMCAKTAHCTYMHEDFPCKFFYLGIPHKESDCIFTHGQPLEPAWQGALLKHVERAPVAILGRFPKAYKTNAAKMLRSTHERMMAALSGTFTMFGGTEVSATPTPAPSTLVASDENGNGNQRQPNNSNPFGKAPNNKQPQKSRACDESGRWSPSGKLRPMTAGSHQTASAVSGNAATGSTDIAEPTDTNESGRWSPSGRLRAIPTSAAAVAASYAPTPPRAALLPSPSMPLNQSSPPSPPPQLVRQPMSTPPPTAAASSTAAPGTGGRCVDLMADILNADQLCRLRQLGVEYISQVDNLTVAQLNEIGLSIAQIHQIQMCSLQASALAATATTHAAAVSTAVVPMLVSSLAPSVGGHRTNGDVDMRIPAMAVASTMSTTFQTPYTVTVAAPATVPLTSDLAAPPPMRPQDALPNNGTYGVNDMELDAVADVDSDIDDGDDDDDDDTDGQLVINDDDATGDENNA